MADRSERKRLILRALIRAFHMAWKLWLGLKYECELARRRRALAKLDDRLLDDIGLSREDVRRECEKLGWWDRPDSIYRENDGRKNKE